MSCTVLALLVVGHQDVRQLLLDQPPLNAVLPGQDGALGTVGVVEHPEDHVGERIQGGGMVGRGDEAGDVVLESLAQNAVKSQIRSDNVLLNPHV